MLLVYLLVKLGEKGLYERVRRKDYSEGLSDSVFF